MEQNGRRYILNREESEQLLRNDLLPQEETWAQRDRFLEEIDRTVQNVSSELRGRTLWQDSTVDEEQLAQLLEKKNTGLYRAEMLVFLNPWQVQDTLREYTIGTKNLAEREWVLV